MTKLSRVFSFAVMDYFLCGVVEVRGLQDQLGITCGRYARTLCSDCGTSLCPDHAQRCDLCAEVFCPSCSSFHQAQREHAKPASAELPANLKRKTA
jgi:predicted sulfurtransferase